MINKKKEIFIFNVNILSTKNTWTYIRNQSTLKDNFCINIQKKPNPNLLIVKTFLRLHDGQLVFSGVYHPSHEQHAICFFMVNEEEEWSVDNKGPW